MPINDTTHTHSQKVAADEEVGRTGPDPEVHQVQNVDEVAHAVGSVIGALSFTCETYSVGLAKDHDVKLALTKQEVVPFLLLICVGSNGEVERDLDRVRGGDPLRRASEQESRKGDSEHAELEG